MNIQTNHFFEEPFMKSKKPLPPLTAIRKHCLECVGNYREEVRTCTGSECHLWPYSFGTNPYRKGKPLTEHEKKGRVLRLAKKA